MKGFFVFKSAQKTNHIDVIWRSVHVRYENRNFVPTHRTSHFN
jgi:hypothetical protein